MKMIHLTVVLLMLITTIVNAQSNATNPSKQMQETTPTIAENKATVRRLYEQSLNKRNLELLNALISPNYTGPNGKRGPEAFVAGPVKALIEAFPDIQWKIQNLLAEDDKVFIWWKVEGTHKASYLNIPATNKTISSDGMAIYTLSNQQIIQSQVFTDRFGFLQQLGILPADIATLINQTHTSNVSSKP